MLDRTKKMIEGTVTMELLSFRNEERKRVGMVGLKKASRSEKEPI
jgi:hypothetical protein